jgi:hypothetical protein
VAESGAFSPSQQDAYLRLLFKKARREQLENYRPLSLLNADRRLLSRALALRLSPLLHLVVHSDQTGFVPGRRIDSNIALVQQLMDEADLLPEASALVLVDFEKAYDRVSHSYLIALLKRLGLGPKARAWLTASFLEQRATPMVNGWRGRSFEIASGVRQGDPLAPALSVLAIEPLAALLRSSLQGIPC